jgi:hypothetical protein
VRLCCGCGAPGLHPPSRRQVPRASVAQARARPCSRARADAARRGTETSSSTARGRCGECEQLRCAECAIDARIGSHRNASRCINDAHCHAVRRMRRFTAHRTAWRARRDTSQCSSDLSHFSYARSRSARYAIRSVTWSRHTRNSLGQTSRTEPHTGTHGEPNNKQTNATRAKCAGCARPFDSIGAKARRVSARRVSMHAGGTTDQRRSQPGRPTTSVVNSLGRCLCRCCHWRLSSAARSGRARRRIGSSQMCASLLDVAFANGVCSVVPRLCSECRILAAQSRCSCGWGEPSPSPSADVAGVSSVLVQMRGRGGARPYRAFVSNVVYSRSTLAAITAYSSAPG